MSKVDNIERMSASDQEEANHTLPKHNNNSRIYFFIIAIAALLATNVYFYVKFKSSGEKLYTMTLQKQDLQIEIDRIEAELDNLVGLKMDVVDPLLQDSEERAREVIENLRHKLDDNSIVESDILKARQEVIRLKGDVSVLRNGLAELKVRNEVLQKENSNLTQKVIQSGKEITNLAEENNSLKDKVVTASALKVSNIQINGINETKKGDMHTETRARRVDKLQILFSVADNDLARAGDKEVFVRVIDPSGNLFGDASNLFYVHGEKLQYTFKEVINFTNNGEEYQFLWSLDKFKKGAYTVLLYSDNAVMGRANVVLR